MNKRQFNRIKRFVRKMIPLSLWYKGQYRYTLHLIFGFKYSITVTRFFCADSIKVYDNTTGEVVLTYVDPSYQHSYLLDVNYIEYDSEVNFDEVYDDLKFQIGK